MRVHELLFEARPENINQPTLDKLFAAYQNKDSQDDNYQSENGLEVAQHIFSAIGPSYLNWVVKQYTNDQHLFLHDLSTLNQQINKFVKLTKSPTVNIERDINKYQSVNDLYTAIQSIDKIENVGGKFWRKAISGIKEFVSRNEAKVLYESPQYVIYQPLSFESSHFLEGIMTTSLCTVMKNGLFNAYSATGVLMYTITQDKMYNCYIATKKSHRFSEFTDQHNNDAFDLDWQIQHFPALKPIVKSVANEHSGLTVSLILEDDRIKARQVAKNSVSSSGYNLRLVPKSMRDKEICRIAVFNQPTALKHVPEESCDYKMCLNAVKEDYSALEFVPEKFKDRTLCLTAIQRELDSSVALNRRIYILRYVPESVWDETLCYFVLNRDLYAYEYIPERLRTKEMRKLVLDKFENDMVRRESSGEYHLSLDGIPEELLKDNWQLCIKILSNPKNKSIDSTMIGHIPREKVDPELYLKLCWQAVRKSHGWALEYVPKDLIDFDMALEATKLDQDYMTLQFVPKHLAKKVIMSLPISAKEKKDLMTDWFIG